MPKAAVKYTKFSDKLTDSLDDISKMIEEHKSMIDAIQEVALELTDSMGTLHKLTVKYAGIANNILDNLLPVIKNMGKRNYILIFILLSMTMLAPIGIDEYTPSLPYMAHAFNTSASILQLTITFYLFALGISQLLVGPISEHYGRKSTLIIGMVLFLIGSAICAFSNK